MNKELCKRFKNVWEDFPDTLGSDRNYKFKDNKHFNKYCNNNCDDNLGKINAASLYLLNEFFGDSSLFKNHNKINIVEYIMIWLSYMLSLIENNDNSVSNLKFFFNIYVNGGNYDSNYNNLLNQKTYYLDMDNNIIINFYKAFKLLCEMYTEFDENKQNCAKCSKKASEFAKKYKELSENYGITSNSPYIQVLSTLSTDYNKLKNECNDISSFPSIVTPQFYEQSSQVTLSSSSIANKLFIVFSIFGAIGIFLGISYKYSLFGFRKRFQKQHLREKLKNIKKRMNH
ncbi:PIR protein [Plasmodium yoelii]|uniref:PIR protein n=2 Tax=Plasmodium yoelii TaxID=5861 RepID=A0AAE9WP49_PLAYO|nr:PIR protein [Plasmodium yoelii]WBY55884.1 PIR protein [Plasmodium yoelii yoelii]CDU16879.1 YIR protein [Plasmodium yoelii]VTZ75134.1 PIR protein [Plasmodium yoelii]|eukprot:XP_022813114.1 PIR protein [Plasmodium yoelii]